MPNESERIDYMAAATAAKGRFEQAFARAKTLSDFVAMLTRLAFLVLLGTLVAHDLDVKSIWSYVIKMCALLAIGGMSIKLALMVAAVIGAKESEFVNLRSAALPGVSRWYPGRLVFEAFTLLALVGLSLSLISYGSRLADRMIDQTHIQNQ